MNDILDMIIDLLDILITLSFAAIGACMVVYAIFVSVKWVLGLIFVSVKWGLGL